MSALSTIVGGLDASNRPAAGRRVPKAAPQPTVRQLVEENNEFNARAVRGVNKTASKAMKKAQAAIARVRISPPPFPPRSRPPPSATEPRFDSHPWVAAAGRTGE